MPAAYPIHDQLRAIGFRRTFGTNYQSRVFTTTSCESIPAARSTSFIVDIRALRLAKPDVPRSADLSDRVVFRQRVTLFSDPAGSLFPGDQFHAHSIRGAAARRSLR